MTIPKIPGQLRQVKSYEVSAGGLGEILAGIPNDFRKIGPVRDKLAVKLSEFESLSELALGVGVTEKRASYRLSQEPGTMDLTGAKPMNSPKSFNFKAQEALYSVRRENGDVNYESPRIEADKKAFFGLHACDVTSLYVLDRTFDRRYRDLAYDQRREDTIVIGLNCFDPGENCFCSTFEAGPDLKGGFDIGLSWIDGHYLVDVATKTGEKIMENVTKDPAPESLVAEKIEKTTVSRRAMKKSFDLKKALTVLDDNYDHPYWNEPSERCLSCANCINVCPTCYCYRVHDQSTVDQQVTTRSRLWDACQNEEFASVHGGNFRPERVDRIRQWVNHKINWTIEQYGVSGCVGCGRCVTWCPTAIDITEPVWRLGGKDIGLKS